MLHAQMMTEKAEMEMMMMMMMMMSDRNDQMQLATPLCALVLFVKPFMVMDDKGGEFVIKASRLCFMSLSFVPKDMYCSCSLFKWYLLYYILLRRDSL